MSKFKSMKVAITPEQPIDERYDAYQAGQQSKQAEIDELQKRIDDALRLMDAESQNSWGLWKEKACMYEQGASNAYEKSYWILKGEETK